MKSLIDTSLLQVICYGFLDEDLAAASDESIHKFLTKGSKNRKNLYEELSQRVKMDGNSTSAINKISSIFASLEKAMKDLGLNSTYSKEGEPYYSEKNQIKLVINQLPKQFKEKVLVSLKFEPPSTLTGKAKALKFLIREAENFSGQWNDSESDVAKPAGEDTLENKKINLSKLRQTLQQGVQTRASHRAQTLAESKS